MNQKTLLITPICSSNLAGRPARCRILVLLKKLAGSLVVVGTILNPAAAATLPGGFTETLVAGGLASPTAMEFAPDGRLFVSQQGGQLRVIKNGSLLATPFVTVTVDSLGERGLLGIAFDPGFATNHFVYIYYTATTPATHNRVSRFTANGDVAVPGSELVILDLNNLSGASNHNGGGLHFGSDGKLYISAGENANPANAQTLANLLGKILRLNADGTIPTNNPFYGTATGVNRAIWAMGLRNPFTFAVQPGTGRMFINDVGQNAWEEINEAIAGANYGWSDCEGFCSPTNALYRDPLFQYPHGGGTSSGDCIAGGAFYNPTTFQFPSTNAGVYFFADYNNGWIRRLDPAQGNSVSLFATGINSPVDLKVGADGRLYYLARDSSAVYAISFVGRAAQAPVFLGSPATFGVLGGATVTSTGDTIIFGDLGVSPGTTVTGSPGVTGTLHLGDPAAAQAQADLTAAYNDAAGRTVDPISVAGNLGGQTLAPGLYKSTSSLEISSGDLTLAGDANAVWIFQMESTLVTTTGRKIILSGGAQAANIFWQVGSSATIGGNSVFKGTIMAAQSITMVTGATLDGRALARVGQVALDSNTITVPNTVIPPVMLVSAATLNGSYTYASGHSVNLATKTITVPVSGNMRYYRIIAGTAFTITRTTVSGGTVVITYN